jgi:hypothetical protein
MEQEQYIEILERLHFTPIWTLIPHKPLTHFKRALNKYYLHK